MTLFPITPLERFCFLPSVSYMGPCCCPPYLETLLWVGSAARHPHPGHVSQVSLSLIRDSVVSARQHYDARVPTSVMQVPLASLPLDFV